MIRSSFHIQVNIAQWQYAAKTRESGVKLKKGMGTSPAFNQYRVRLEASPLAKASHWGNLRRQNLFC